MHSNSAWAPTLAAQGSTEWLAPRIPSAPNLSQERWRGAASLPSGSFRWVTNKVDPTESTPQSEIKEVKEIADIKQMKEIKGLGPSNVSIVVSDVADENTLEDSGVAPELALSLEEQLAIAFRAVQVNGYVAVEVLPGVLGALNLACEVEAIQRAIRCVIPNPEEEGKVSLKQALLVLQHTLDAKDSSGEESSKDAAEPTEVVDFSQNRTLCQLLATVVVVIFLCAATVAGLAILWLWLTSVGQSGNYLQMDLNLNEDMLRVMLHDDYVAQRQHVALDYAVIVGTLVEEMGYGLTDKMSQDGLGTAALLLKRTIDAWWQMDSMTGLADTAKMLATVVGLLSKNLSLSKVANLTDRLNNETLPYGHELLLAKQVNSSLQYLTQLRFAAECNASACDLGSAANQPMLLALSNKSGAVRGVDYRGQPVVAGYTNTSVRGVGVVYKVDSETLLESFAERIASIADALNQESTDGREVLFARILPDGSMRYTTQLHQCTGSCLAAQEEGLPTGNTAMPRALRGLSGILENVDYRGIPVIAGFTYIPSCRIGVVVKVSRETLKASILQKLATIINGINKKFTTSEELELQTSFTMNETQYILPLTAYRSADQCPNHTCVTPSYIKMAANGCQTGSAVTNNYRGVSVTAGFMCLPDLDSYVAYSVDQAEIVANEVTMAVESTDKMNSDTASSYELVLGKPLDGTSRFAVSKGIGQDFTTVTRQVFASEYGCTTGFCTGAETCMQSALRGFQGILACVNYAGFSSLAAATYLNEFQLGFTAELDMTEVMSPVISTTFILVGVSCGALFGTAVLLSWYTRVMVKSMMVAEREGQDTILQEKQRFSALVESMYPAYVVSRVLAGDQNIVQMLPQTAVFFSDIYNFMMASSKITSEELLQLMGYTYGVMDKVADHFHITKVKTVGDAYLAISGLPGVETSNCCMDMMRFASTVAQVFSCKFDHPSQGNVLEFFLPRVGKGKEGGGSFLGTNSSRVQSMQASVAPRQSIAVGSDADHQSGNISDHKSSTSAGTDPYGSVPKVRCVMSYGIAAGPVTAGVLQGKSPMFDIWGKTVNLASRMQSTGLPGRIQVSELFYKSLVAIPGQQYSFEESHQTMCKGFGLVRCYFVQSTMEAPPVELVELLGLEPNLGLFFYDSPVSHIHGSFYQRADPASSSNAPALPTITTARSNKHRHSTGPARSPGEPRKTSKNTPSPPKSPRSLLRTNPQVRRREDPMDLLEVDQDY